MRGSPLPLVLLCACTQPVLLPLGPPHLHETGQEPMLIVVRGQPDPLPLRGSRVAWTGLDKALKQAVSSAVRPPAGPRPLELLIEVSAAEARRRGGRVEVSMSGRATLYGREDRSYLGQASFICREAALATPEKAQPVFSACLTTIGRDVSGWLGSLGL